MKLFFALVALALASCSHSTGKISLLAPEAFESTADDGTPIALYTLHAGNVTMQVTNYGARVVTLFAPDRDGNMEDIAVGYENIDRYINNSGERYLGAAVGPVANRIAEGRFTLDGVEYTLPRNNNGQTLHGGEFGVDRIAWQVKEVSDESITLLCTLPDGQDGFPGNRNIEMCYRLTPDNEFVVTYLATTDAPTVMNLSHHSFFNLGGEGTSILGHELRINSSAITPVDARLIPTGDIMPVEGTPFDFREAKSIGRDIASDDEQLRCGGGYDHNWIIDREDDGSVVEVADLYDPQSGRGIVVSSDQVAVQFYCGNFFDGSYTGKYGKPVIYRGAVALETQRYPDAPNHASFPSVVLRPGEEYTHTCIYKFYAK